MLGIVTAVALAAVVGLPQLAQQRAVRTDRVLLFDYGTAAAYVAAHKQPGDAVLFDDGFFRKIRLGYPEDFRGVPDIALQPGRGPAQVGTFRGRSVRPAQLPALMARHARLWVLGRFPAVPLATGPFSVESRVLHRSYHCAAHERNHRVSVSLWVRDAPAPGARPVR